MDYDVCRWHCNVQWEQVEQKLEMWRCVWEKKGINIGCSKSEYICVNERDTSVKVMLQWLEVKKVECCRYLRSTVQSNGVCGKVVKKSMQAGCNGWRKVSGVMSDESVTAKMKGKVYMKIVSVRIEDAEDRNKLREMFGVKTSEGKSWKRIRRLVLFAFGRLMLLLLLFKPRIELLKNKNMKPCFNMRNNEGNKIIC